jgi:2-phospho-L-lactate/phosphoenolpyruvate guanylyltransferase
VSTLAVLPIKSFSEAKRRLAHELSPRFRRTLAAAMFSDVLTALGRAGAVDGILVVSADPDARRIARGHGTIVIDDDDAGHNAAAQHGIARALQEGAGRALLVPGDCPLLDPDETDGLIARWSAERSALIVPDRHGTGTNALLLSPPGSLAPSFGPGSCERHAADAKTAGIAYEVVRVPSLSLDVDTPEDLAALLAALASMHGGAAHTRGTLGELSEPSQKSA